MPFSNVAFSNSFGVGFDRIDPPDEVAQPHGSASGWQMPHYEKEKKPKLVEVEQIEEQAKEPEKVELVKASQPSLKLVEDIGLKQDKANLLEVEIKALELAVEQDRLDTLQAEALITALKQQREEEELMMLLLLATV